MPYYVVARGHVPGIYRTWYGCLDQITRYSDCDFRKRFCHSDAVRYLNRRRIVGDYYDCGVYNDDAEYTNYYYYTVSVGETPGIYRSWPACKYQIWGWRGADYRKYCCYMDAKNFLRRRGVKNYYDECQDEYSSSDEESSDDYYDY